MRQPLPSWRAIAASSLCLLVMACEGDRATRPVDATASPSARTAGLPPGPLVLLPDGLALVAATHRADSANLPIRIAQLRVRGSVGDTVALTLDADSTVLAAAGNSVQLVVGGGDAPRSVPLAQLVTGVTVYRFARTETVTLVYLLTKRATARGDGAFRLVHHTSAVVTEAERPWAVQEAAALAAAASGTSCLLSASTGTCGGVTWTIAPYSGGGSVFQSSRGTGPSSPITITFSQPVARVRTTINDPTYAGNTMEAFSDGVSGGSVSFASSGVPGVNTPDTQELAGSITSVLLTPAPGDFVWYQMEITLSTLPTLELKCEPTPVMRGDPVTCTARLSDGSAFSNPLASIDPPEGVPSFFTGTLLQGGKSWKSEGPALFSTRLTLSVSRKGKGVPDQIQRATQIVVSGRTTFPKAAFPGLPTEPATLGTGAFGFTDHYVGLRFQYGLFETRPDTGALGTVPIIDPTDGPFQNGWAILGTLPQLPYTRPIVHLSAALLREGGPQGLYQDQDGQDATGQVGRNGRPVCNNAADPGWVDRLRAFIERHEGIGGAPNSHYGIFVQQFARANGPHSAVEALAFPSTEPQSEIKRRMLDAMDHWSAVTARPEHQALDSLDLDGSMEKLDVVAGCSIDIDTTELPPSLDRVVIP